MVYVQFVFFTGVTQMNSIMSLSAHPRLQVLATPLTLYAALFHHRMVAKNRIETGLS